MIQINNLKILSKKFSWQRFLILIAFVLFSAFLICALIYAELNEIIKTQDEQINLLNNQINTTSKNIHNLSLE